MSRCSGLAKEDDLAELGRLRNDYGGQSALKSEVSTALASALDKTARRVEESFASVQTSQRELETLLNSMQDAVIAIEAKQHHLPFTVLFFLKFFL